MLLINIIAVGVIVLCLAVVLVVIGKRFPQLTNVDAEALPEQKEAAVKQRLAKEKIHRAVSQKIGSVQRWLRPHQQRLTSAGGKLYQRVLELERSYRKKLEPKTPHEREQVDQKTTSLVWQGRELLAAEKYADAERKFIDAITLDPRDVDAYQALGELYWAQGELDQARETYEYILKLNSDNFNAYSHLGNIALRQGKLEAARDYHRRSVELDTQAAIHHLELGSVYRELGNEAEAYECFNKAVGLEPRHPRYLDALLESCILLGKKGEAQELLQRLTEVNPDNQKLGELSERVTALKAAGQK